jgi:glycosyltransferase involved in cell wall biosynthesis
MAAEADLTIVHLGAGKYRPRERAHVTFDIWHELAVGFRHYHVIARSAAKPADWSEGNLRITLIRSWLNRELEFVFTQFAAVQRMVRDRPNAIVCQSPVAGGLAAIWVSRITGARLLIELHSDVYFPPFRIGSKAWLYHYLSRPALRRADRIRVLSGGMQQRLAQSFGEEIARKARVVAPRVDLSRFVPKSWESGHPGPLRAILVGSIIPRKGQLRLINALATVPFPIDLHLVGEGPDLGECRDRAAQSAGNLHIICHGAIPPTALPALLQQADLFVLYSNSEGTPRAIMEAMAAGLPVITTNAGFCADIVEHGREGFVLGADPDREIIEVLDRFRQDPDLAERMGAAARERARRDYDSVRLFEEYRQLIEETART